MKKLRAVQRPQYHPTAVRLHAPAEHGVVSAMLLSQSVVVVQHDAP